MHYNYGTESLGLTTLEYDSIGVGNLTFYGIAIVGGILFASMAIAIAGERCAARFRPSLGWIARLSIVCGSFATSLLGFSVLSWWASVGPRTAADIIAEAEEALGPFIETYPIDVNWTDDDGNSLLAIAVRHRDVDGCLALVKAGASIGVRNHDGLRPIDLIGDSLEWILADKETTETDAAAIRRILESGGLH